MGTKLGGLAFVLGLALIPFLFSNSSSAKKLDSKGKEIVIEEQASEYQVKDYSE